MPTSGAFSAPPGAPNARAPPNARTWYAPPAPAGAAAPAWNANAATSDSPAVRARRLRMSTYRRTAQSCSVLRLGSVSQHGVGQAVLVVLGEHDRRTVATCRAVGIAPHLVVAERLLEGIVREQPAAEGFSDVEQELDRLERLDRSDDAGQHAEHAGLGARRRELRRRRLGQEAPVARSVVRIEDGDLSLEPEDRSVHDRDALQQ